MRLQEIIEIERRLIGVGIANEAEWICGQTAIRASRKIVIVSNIRIRRKLFLPAIGFYTILASS